MEAIAHEMRVSRSSVSRLLGFARESGLVEVTIRSPQEDTGRLQGAIHQRYGVAVHIVPIPDHTSDIDRLDRVALSAARMLGQFLDSSMTVGIAWGSTLSAVSRHLVPHPLHDVKFVQLNGAGNTRTTGIVYASEILRRFADAYTATSEQFPVPAFFDDAATKAALWKERGTRRILELQKRADLAIMSLGSPFAVVPSHVYIGGYLDREDYAALRTERVVGDAATVFYRADGSHRDIPINTRASGPDLDALRRVPRRVVIVSGVSKLASLRGALAAGLITDLIIDEGMARALTAAP
ncbi:MAG TPA: sugar-binding domain-containing protein [Microbacteriaceae bacterium]|nr:sugar-binding domain-containing protein [Microbacteriaceae bacterium]